MGVEYLHIHPCVTLSELLAGSADVRRAPYEWLFSFNRKATQDRSIRVILEADAFKEVHRIRRLP